MEFFKSEEHLLIAKKKEQKDCESICTYDSQWELVIVLKNGALNGGFFCSRASLFLEF